MAWMLASGTALLLMTLLVLLFEELLEQPMRPLRIIPPIGMTYGIVSGICLIGLVRYAPDELQVREARLAQSHKNWKWQGLPDESI
jgi:hypothetical protein